ncbi:hypothetical protein TEA_005563 [Camellia sinensis var. sinensis]|uniref:GDSL esterase/lipase n=1 Tax=Camellia sinensis var. sinensis TaxID=542762 RepID=A0A4S4ETG0_CAMSN|nr:hypothetical protein TEA_005563 [Camellia sinensis var. sinensis]
MKTEQSKAINGLLLATLTLSFSWLLYYPLCFDRHNLSLSTIATSSFSMQEPPSHLQLRGFQLRHGGPRRWTRIPRQSAQRPHFLRHIDRSPLRWTPCPRSPLPKREHELFEAMPRLTGNHVHKWCQFCGGFKYLINDEGFNSALYMIDIGQNDIADSFTRNLSYVQVIKRIPSIIIEIKNAVKAIYGQGGRKFWIHNTGPLGCLPQKLSMVQRRPNDVDPYGCLSSYNAAARIFNEGLRHLCEEMRSEMVDAIIVYVDIYSIKYDLIANYTKHGFSKPLAACCGFGGPPYNYNIKVPCGHGYCS